MAYAGSFVSGVLGVAAGIVCAVILGKTLGPKDSQRAERAESPAPPGSFVAQPASGSPSNANDEIRALQARLRALEEGSARSQPPHSSSVQDRGAAPGRDVEAELAAQKELLRKYDEEPRDPKWARATEQAFRSDLQAVAGARGFQVTSVECRSETCNASLQWPSYASARKEGPTLLHGEYSRNCARTVLLPPPTDFTRPYDGVVLFHCENEGGG